MMKSMLSLILTAVLLSSCYSRRFNRLSPLEKAFTDNRDRNDEKYGVYNPQWIYFYSKYDTVKSITNGTVEAVYNFGDMFSVVIKSDSCNYVYHNMRKVVVFKDQRLSFQDVLGYAKKIRKKYLLKLENNCKKVR